VAADNDLMMSIAVALCEGWYLPVRTRAVGLPQAAKAAIVQ
jgi:hypothetical protein